MSRVPDRWALRCCGASSVAKTIAIAPIDDAEAEVWRLAREVAHLLTGLPWVLIGGLMVRVAEAERGVTTTFTTGDVDTVLDVRAISTATAEAATRLLAADFHPEPYDERLTYRFVRGNDVVDVLAPDNLGERADITTVPPGETIGALGSRQALNRRRVVTVDAGDGPFDLPVPSLLGSIIIKARVVTNVQGKASQPKHERDLARLLALVDDPVAMRSGLNRKERRYLRDRMALADPDHRAWRGVRGAEDGAIALSMLAEAGEGT
jgi:hypothetical protein